MLAPMWQRFLRCDRVSWLLVPWIPCIRLKAGMLTLSCKRRAPIGANRRSEQPPTALAFAFGPGSSRRHKALAEADNLAVSMLNLPDLAADIDKPADLIKLRARPHRGKTGQFLDLLDQNTKSLGERADESA